MVKFETNGARMKQVNVMSLKSVNVFVIALSLVFIIFGVKRIVEGVNYLDNKALVFGIILVVFGLVFYPVMKISGKRSQQNADNESSSNNTVREIFEFTASEITIEAIGQNEISSTNKLSYQNLLKIVETEKYFYVFITAQQAYVIPKTSLIEGSFNELIGYLNQNFSKINATHKTITYSN